VVAQWMVRKCMPKPSVIISRLSVASFPKLPNYKCVGIAEVSKLREMITNKSTTPESYLD